ncbi:MAG TPA: DsbA family protein [Jatrophihabitans sp.]|jgi:2-hydroxychromene-2-carboxylate isomerase|uniref:2-hydroxychromene-2-carboxylate isomerase n=1 Tax=Jatrophihabitans sp. TaxID=1932789 RepID=UPI002F24D731
MSRAPREPVFYFSLRSPYSWLAYRDLLARYPDVAERARWEPFWEPDESWRRTLTEAGGRFHYVDMSRAKAMYILQDVRRLAQERGLAISWPIDRAPRWEVAHLAFLRARRCGAGRPFVDAAYRARWEQGRDISDPATMGEIAAELGLDPQAHACAADDPELRQEALEALLALDRDGVFGVPFFTLGRDRFWGLDRLANFAAAVRATPAAVESPASVEAAPVEQEDRVEAAREPDELVRPGGDAGHAGGCG